MSSGWYPIESAPKDKQVLGLSIEPTTGEPYITTIWWCALFGNGEWLPVTGMPDGDYLGDEGFTHWMPLPEPPND